MYSEDQKEELAKRTERSQDPIYKNRTDPLLVFIILLPFLIFHFISGYSLCNRDIHHTNGNVIARYEKTIQFFVCKKNTEIVVKHKPSIKYRKGIMRRMI